MRRSVAFTGPNAALVREAHLISGPDRFSRAPTLEPHGRSSTTSDFKDQIESIDTWYAERFADLVRMLRDTTDSDGQSLLANTLVVWGRDLGKGFGHNRKNTPFVLAGGSAFMDTGHNRLLVSICQLMGLTDVDEFGDLDQGGGALPGLD